MSEKAVTIRLPDSVHERLSDVAEASGWTLEEVILQSIRTGMPPSLQKIPDKYHQSLLALNVLDDQTLWDVGQGEQVDAAPGEVGSPDQELLRRAYAYALLKWRGHPLPDPNEFLL
jgi:hypothetical protein